MNNLYVKFLRGVNNSLFKSFRSAFVMISNRKINPRSNSNEYTSFYETDRQKDSEKIRGDYRKIGDDLFGALNDYEQRKGYKLTTKK